jgi:hypothetical protein
MCWRVLAGVHGAMKALMERARVEPEALSSMLYTIGGRG